MFDINLNPVEIISGTTNRTSPLYIEAAKTIDSSTPKSMGYLKNFITSIEKVASSGNVSDSRISSTRGDIKKFSGYENIKDAIKFLNENLSGIGFVRDLVSIHNALEANQSQYTDGYSKNIRLIVLEYESGLYLLVTGLVHAMVNNIDIVQTGTKIVVKRKSGAESGIIIKTANGLARELSAKGHKHYLEELITLREKEPVKETNKPMEESVKDVADTLEIMQQIIQGVSRVGGIVKGTFQTLKRTVFGILPLIRSCIYLHYKKKADTVLALEEQMQFIRMNIDQLKNIKTMDEKKKANIIRRQEAQIEMRRKKAEKIRAEFIETEREVATAIKSDDSDIKKDSSPDFVLD